MTDVDQDENDGAPPRVVEVQAPLVRRQVWLQNESGERLGYACSWWNAHSVKECLKDRQKPIWASLSAGRTELFREIVEIQRGTNSYLAEEFDCDEQTDLWGRHYLFWRNGEVLCLIKEVFSPKLSQFLGPP